jgi:hypothetical protein
MNELLDTDPEYAPMSGATEGQQRRDSGRWSGTRVSHALKRIYEERGMAWVPNGRHMISHADQELLKALHEDHGSRATARMLNKLGKVTATGKPWITDDVDRMIARLERIERISKVGRKRLLLDDEIAVVTTMRDRGSSLAEIQAFLAAQPTPIHVSVPTLSRRITEHRNNLAAAALSARNHA